MLVEPLDPFGGLDLQSPELLDDGQLARARRLLQSYGGMVLGAHKRAMADRVLRERITYTPGGKTLIATMKALPLRLTALRSFKEAVITRGGVDLRDVDPGTMASRLCRGLYFAGEVLDVDALTGGFNLQIAFSTGALAGHSAADYVSRSV